MLLSLLSLLVFVFSIRTRTNIHSVTVTVFNQDVIAEGAPGAIEQPPWQWMVLHNPIPFYSRYSARLLH